MNGDSGFQFGDITYCCVAKLQEDGTLEFWAPPGNIVHMSPGAPCICMNP